jgi:hypothetical protein
MGINCCPSLCKPHALELFLNVSLGLVITWRRLLPEEREKTSVLAAPEVSIHSSWTPDSPVFFGYLSLCLALVDQSFESIIDQRCRSTDNLRLQHNDAHKDDLATAD